MAGRIGIFGGTFDPPHIGHLMVAADAFEALDLDRLLFIPAATPPHKRSGVVASAAQRLAMLQAAIGDDSRFAVDDVEIRRGGASYTVETLRELRNRDASAEMTFLLGIDQYRSLDSWREPAAVSRLATLGVLARGGETLELAGPYSGVAVPVRRVDVSSTEVRERIAGGRPTRYLVPETVAAVIERNGLYRE